MKAIVTGATGFLGKHLVSLLEEKNYHIIALGRDRDKGILLTSALTTFKVADNTNKHELDAAFEQADIVFHCAALSSAWGHTEDFERANVHATRNVLACCEKWSIKRLVYVSSTSVYFDYQNKTNILEDQCLPNHFVNDYARTKFEGEALLLAERENTEVVIIRPRGIIGEGDTAIMPRILRIANKGFFPLINQGEAVVDLTYVKNVAHALVLAGETAGIDGKSFNISNLEPLTVKALLQKVFKQRQQTCRLVHVNYQFIYHIAKVTEFIAKHLSLGEPSITCYGVGLLATTQTLNVEAAKKNLGYQPLYTLDYGIEQYLAAEREQFTSC